MFIREKKIKCGSNYQEVDIIPRTIEAERNRLGHRIKRKRVSLPKQKNLNDKNAKRYLLQLVNGNFDNRDLHVSLTYSDEFLPKTIEDAKKEVTNYLRRLAARRKKLGLEPLKYIVITEGTRDKNDGYLKRVHHHIIMNGGIDRDEVEDVWSKKKKTMGWVNARKIQTNENGAEALAIYLTKDPQGKKRWSSSRNLTRPVELEPNDSRYSKRKIEKMAMSNDLGREIFEREFKDFYIADVRSVYYELTGWHIYLKMWRKEKADANQRI
ncbi:hypothetical protein LABALGNA3A7_09520 [Dellaglioa algida]|nr:hypothetical protein LABALGNA3A7_09520 [Dellaglioa algida]